MPEFRLYFKDADDAHAAERRVVAYDSEIRSEDDVRTDLREYCEQNGGDPVRVAREYQRRLRNHQSVGVAWPASRSDDEPDSGWELILQASSIEDVQAFVGVDLDYSWETG